MPHIHFDSSYTYTSRCLPQTITIARARERQVEIISKGETKKEKIETAVLNLKVFYFLLWMNERISLKIQRKRAHERERERDRVREQKREMKENVVKFVSCFTCHAQKPWFIRFINDIYNMHSLKAKTFSSLHEFSLFYSVLWLCCSVLGFFSSLRSVRCTLFDGCTFPMVFSSMFPFLTFFTFYLFFVSNPFTHGKSKSKLLSICTLCVWVCALCSQWKVKRNKCHSIRCTSTTTILRLTRRWFFGEKNILEK